MHAYRQVLSVPGAARTSGAAFLARLPGSMTGLGSVLLLTAEGGNYGLAGVITAIYILGAAIGGPFQGKTADTVGQRPVLLVAAGLFVSGSVLFLLFVHFEVSIIASAAAAFVAGLGSPQSGSLMRARWTNMLKEQPRLLQTAFAFEAVVDEAVFIAGPVIATVVATTLAPNSALILAVCFGLIGSVLMAYLRSTEPKTNRHLSKKERPPIGVAFMVPVVAVGVGIGMMFGATEIIVVAFASERDVRSLSGAVLAIWSFGSLLAGVLIGILPVVKNQLRRLQFALGALSFTFAPLIFVDSIWVLAVLMFLGGSMIAPSLISAISLIEKHVPPERLTEGIAWSSMGATIGIAPGAAIAGYLIGEYGAATAFALPFVAGVVATMGALFAIPWALRRLPSTAARVD